MWFMVEFWELYFVALLLILPVLYGSCLLAPSGDALPNFSNITFLSVTFLIFPESYSSSHHLMQRVTPLVFSTVSGYEHVI